VVSTRRVDFVPRGLAARLKYALTDRTVAISPAIARILADFDVPGVVVIPSAVRPPETPLTPGAARAVLEELAGARAVGDRTRLDFLYLLTCADIAGTSPKLWNTWKERLLGDLYDATRLAFRRGLEHRVDAEARVAEARSEVRALLADVDEDALVQILIEPKNALIKQYQKLFAMEDVELEVRPSALSAIARKALERKTGARGLRSILEQVLLDTMYELPGMENVTKVVIDENMITGDSQPLLIYADQPKVSGSN